MAKQLIRRGDVLILMEPLPAGTEIRLSDFAYSSAYLAVDPKDGRAPWYDVDPPTGVIQLTLRRVSA